MIKSMTGYGRSELKTDLGTVTAEAKSFNSKNLNIIVKLPDSLSYLDMQIAGYVKNKISRGQVNILIDINKNGSSTNKKANIDILLLKEYCDIINSLKESFSITDPINLQTLLSLPGVLNVDEKEENSNEILSDLLKALDVAIAQLLDMREKEGMVVLEDITERLEIISKTVENIAIRTPEIINEYRERLRKRIQDLVQDQNIMNYHLNIDESRIAMEVSIMAERSDINEELVRLRSHINQFKDTLLKIGEPVGRQLDFILQEINREVNTISSKANDYQISAECIRLKNETEKIREQAQNIE